MLQSSFSGKSAVSGRGRLQYALQQSDCSQHERKSGRERKASRSTRWAETRGLISDIQVSCFLHGSSWILYRTGYSVVPVSQDRTKAEHAPVPALPAARSPSRCFARFCSGNMARSQDGVAVHGTGFGLWRQLSRESSVLRRSLRARSGNKSIVSPYFTTTTTTAGFWQEKCRQIVEIKREASSDRIICGL